MNFHHLRDFVNFMNICSVRIGFLTVYSMHFTQINNKGQLRVVWLLTFFFFFFLIKKIKKNERECDKIKKNKKKLIYIYAHEHKLICKSDVQLNVAKMLLGIFDHLPQIKYVYWVLFSFFFLLKDIISATDDVVFRL